VDNAGYRKQDVSLGGDVNLVAPAIFKGIKVIEGGIAKVVLEFLGIGVKA